MGDRRGPGLEHPAEDCAFILRWQSFHSPMPQAVVYNLGKAGLELRPLRPPALLLSSDLADLVECPGHLRLP